MLSAVFLTAAALAITGEKNVGSQFLNLWEQFEVPGQGEPEYTDDEAAAFEGLLNKLNADPERKSGGRWRC